MADPIWNDICNEANRFDHTAPMKGSAQGGPTRSSRATAIVHLAMFDAHFGVTGLTSEVPQLYTGGAVPAYAGPSAAKQVSAAVSAAAHQTLSALYPEQISRFADAALKIAALNETDSAAHRYGIAIGRAILAMRTGDGSAIEIAQPYSQAKPHHRADPLNTQLEPLGSAWGNVRPFAVTSFHNQAPYPAFKSAAYNADHKEVMAKGGSASQTTTTRTTQETVIGLYWAYDGARMLGTPPRLYNQIVQVIARKMGNSVADNARLFALVNVAMGDAGIHAWFWKYYYDLWLLDHRHSRIRRQFRARRGAWTTRRCPLRPILAAARSAQDKRRQSGSAILHAAISRLSIRTRHLRRGRPGNGAPILSPERSGQPWLLRR